MKKRLKAPEYLKNGPLTLTEISIETAIMLSYNIIQPPLGGDTVCQDGAVHILCVLYSSHFIENFLLALA